MQSGLAAFTAHTTPLPPPPYTHTVAELRCSWFPLHVSLQTWPAPESRAHMLSEALRQCLWCMHGHYAHLFHSLLFPSSCNKLVSLHRTTTLWHLGKLFIEFHPLTFYAVSTVNETRSLSWRSLSSGEYLKVNIIALTSLISRTLLVSLEKYRWASCSSDFCCLWRKRRFLRSHAVNPFIIRMPEPEEPSEIG